MRFDLPTNIHHRPRWAMHTHECAMASGELVIAIKTWREMEKTKREETPAL
jgi:hypothetical protein